MASFCVCEDSLLLGVNLALEVRIYPYNKKQKMKPQQRFIQKKVLLLWTVWGEARDWTQGLLMPVKYFGTFTVCMLLMSALLCLLHSAHQVCIYSSLQISKFTSLSIHFKIYSLSSSFQLSPCKNKFCFCQMVAKCGNIFILFLMFLCNIFVICFSLPSAPPVAPHTLTKTHVLSVSKERMK